MIHINFYQDTRRKNISGQYLVCMTLSDHGTKTMMSTGHKISIEDFTDIKNGKASTPILRHIKIHLDRMKLEAEETALILSAQGIKPTPSVLKNALLEKNDPTLKEERIRKESEESLLVTWFHRRMELKTGKTLDSINQTLVKVLAYDPKATLDSLSPSWLQKFDAFMAKTSPSPNARAVHMRNLRAVINYAIDEEATDNYPFRRYRIKTVKTAKRSLKVEELRALFNAPVDDTERKYLDMFKLIFMLIGINSVDLLHLKHSDMQCGRIVYHRSKTKRLYSIKVEPEAMEIIERYRGCDYLIDPLDKVGNWEHYRRRMNKALSTLGNTIVGKHGKKVKEPMFPGLTTYWARHTWATIARSIGISVDDIALALGHGDNHDLTHIYIDDDLEKIDIANRRVLDWVLYGKK